MKYNIKLTSPMEHSPSWEANSHSTSKEIQAFYGNGSFIIIYKIARDRSLS